MVKQSSLQNPPTTMYCTRQQCSYKSAESKIQEARLRDCRSVGLCCGHRQCTNEWLVKKRLVDSLTACGRGIMGWKALWDRRHSNGKRGRNGVISPTVSSVVHFIAFHHHKYSSSWKHYYSNAT